MLYCFSQERSILFAAEANNLAPQTVIAGLLSSADYDMGQEKEVVYASRNPYD